MESVEEYVVAPRASRFIRMLWSVENPSESIIEKQILPNGCFNIVVVSGNAVEAIIKGTRFEFKPGVYLASQMTETTIAILKPKSRLFFIQLRVWVFSLNSRRNLSEFIDTVRELEYFKFPFSHQILNKQIENNQFCVKLANSVFSKLNKKYPKINLIENIHNYINSRIYELKISELEKEFGLSLRSLQTKFKNSTGITLKGYIKVVKFRETLKHIIINKGNLTEYSIKYGYFDQAHLCKNFKNIAKLSPKKISSDIFYLPECF
jgi:AraC-like DNA-binding protein